MSAATRRQVVSTDTCALTAVRDLLERRCNRQSPTVTTKPQIHPQIPARQNGDTAPVPAALPTVPALSSPRWCLPSSTRVQARRSSTPPAGVVGARTKRGAFSGERSGDGVLRTFGEPRKPLTQYCTTGLLWCVYATDEQHVRSSLRCSPAMVLSWGFPLAERYFFVVQSSRTSSTKSRTTPQKTASAILRRRSAREDLR